MWFSWGLWLATSFGARAFFLLLSAGCARSVFQGVGNRECRRSNKIRSRYNILKTEEEKCSVQIFLYARLAFANFRASDAIIFLWR